MKKVAFILFILGMLTLPVTACRKGPGGAEKSEHKEGDGHKHDKEHKEGDGHNHDGEHKEGDGHQH